MSCTAFTLSSYTSLYVFSYPRHNKSTENKRRKTGTRNFEATPPKKALLPFNGPITWTHPISLFFHSIFVFLPYIVKSIPLFYIYLERLNTRIIINISQQKNSPSLRDTQQKTVSMKTIDPTGIFQEADSPAVNLAAKPASRAAPFGSGSSSTLNFGLWCWLPVPFSSSAIPRNTYAAGIFSP